MHINAFTNGKVGVIMILLQMCHIKAKGLTAKAQGPAPNGKGAFILKYL